MNRFVNLSRLRRRALLDPVAKIKDARQAWRVMYPLREVLFLVCGTIARRDDYDDIVDWSNALLALRKRRDLITAGTIARSERTRT
jgi:hypothetical protein